VAGKLKNTSVVRSGSYGEGNAHGAVSITVSATASNPVARALTLGAW
jgi:hypothetical protein